MILLYLHKYHNFMKAKFHYLLLVIHLYTVNTSNKIPIPPNTLEFPSFQEDHSHVIPGKVRELQSGQGNWGKVRGNHN